MKTRKVKVLLSVLTVMLVAWTFNSCSKKNDVVSTNFASLTAGLTAATTLLNASSEGTASGDFTRGFKAILQAAITAAQAVADNKATTQIEETAAAAQLAAAVTTFQAAAVVPIDPTNLVGQWTFDELTTAAVGTSVKDYSGSNF